jgi:solute carrier family 25 protein 39/40
MSSPAGTPENVTIYQQMISSATGALVVSLSRKFFDIIEFFILIFIVTPLDVIKIRLQNQLHPLAKGECFLFSNGLMDHLCTSCSEPIPPTKCEWFNRPGHFSGTFDALVKIARNEGGKCTFVEFLYPNF